MSRKMVLPAALLLCCAFLAGCYGRLNRQVITRRDLTPEEYQKFYKTAGERKVFYFWPIFCSEQLVDMSMSDKHLGMDKVSLFCNVSLPFVDVGYYTFARAFFNSDGKRIARIQGVGLAPLFTFAETDTRSEDGSWQHWISRSTFLQYFGFGNFRGENFCQIFLVLGKNRMDVEENTPLPLPSDSFLARKE